MTGQGSRGRQRLHHPMVLMSLVGLVAWVSGCASLNNVQQRYVACSYDTVWQNTLKTLKDYPLDVADERAGLIETAWIETPVRGRPYGLFRREGLGDKERVRSMVALTRRQDVTIVRLSERREHFGFRGGARIYQWYPVEPSREAMEALMSRLTTRLEEQGCFVGT